jgi:hypothetical protein
MLTNALDWSNHLRDGPLAVPFLRVPQGNERIIATRGEEPVHWMYLNSRAGRCVAVEFHLCILRLLVFVEEGRLKAWILQNPSVTVRSGGIYPLPTPAKRNIVGLDSLLMRCQRCALCG